MNTDSIRAYCLSFPQTKEKLQWGESLCFKVGEKIFAILSLDLSHGSRLVFKCTPEIFSELIEREGIRPSPYVGRYHWVALERLDILPNDELEDLIRHSYEIVAAKAIRKAKPRKRRHPAQKVRKHKVGSANKNARRARRS
jgi:predicted DNA-binding protein (MmcQ/YjbR family)